MAEKTIEERLKFVEKSLESVMKILQNNMTRQMLLPTIAEAITNMDEDLRVMTEKHNALVELTANNHIDVLKQINNDIAVTEHLKTLIAEPLKKVLDQLEFIETLKKQHQETNNK